MSKLWNSNNAGIGTASKTIDLAPTNCGSFPAKQAGVAALLLMTGAFFLVPTRPALADQDSIVHTAPPSQSAPINPPTEGAEVRGRVVRLSHVEGTVQILRGGETEFSHAVMNMPLVEGTRITTGADGRAEIEFEDGSVARLTPDSALDLSKFDAGAEDTLDTSVQQVSGLVYYELRSDPSTQFHVVAGGRTVTPVANSTFRVNLGASPDNVAVIAGAIQLRNGAEGTATEVRQGKTAQFQATGGEQFTVADGITPNGFDEWNDQRDQEAAKQAANQTPARMQGGGSAMDGGIGWSDLDNNGGWYPVPGYGMMWQPSGVGADFDPYGDGLWADIGGDFGYSWVSGYSWGWLPFHYGMWTYIGGFGWGWSPCGYPFGGGFGYGYGYRYGHRDHDRDGHGYPRTNVYGGPAGYRAPTPPTVAKGSVAPRIVTVGHGVVPTTARWNGSHASQIAGMNALRPVKISGTKIEPLHSMAVNVPIRNAALFNNAPAHAYAGNLRTSLEGRGAIRIPAAMPGTLQGGSHGLLRGSMGGMLNTNHAQSFNTTRGLAPAAHPFAPSNQARFGQHASSFGQHTSFGSHGSFGGAQSGYSGGGGFRGGSAGSGFHSSGSGGHSGGMPGGGMSSGGGGGFHGGGMSSGAGGGHIGR